MKSFLQARTLDIFGKLNLEYGQWEQSIHFLRRLRHPFYNPKTIGNRRVILEFGKLFYNQGTVGGTWNNTRWLGVKVLKNPLDLWVYQEIIFEIKPDVIIETGTAYGGSALYFASICDLLSKGRVVTIDVNRPPVLIRHKRVVFLHGSSLDLVIFNKVKGEARRAKKTLVILDSDHWKGHVAKELKLYSQLVSVGSYLIVEDTIVNNHPVRPDFGPGPYEAVGEFLKENKNFRVDKTRGKFLISNNPNGFLKRTR